MRPRVDRPGLQVRRASISNVEVSHGALLPLLAEPRKQKTRLRNSTECHARPMGSSGPFRMARYSMVRLPLNDEPSARAMPYITSLISSGETLPDPCCFYNREISISY
jgi:hypothetical protein